MLGALINSFVLFLANDSRCCLFWLLFLVVLSRLSRSWVSWKSREITHFCSFDLCLLRELCSKCGKPCLSLDGNGRVFRPRSISHVFLTHLFKPLPLCPPKSQAGHLSSVNSSCRSAPKALPVEDITRKGLSNSVLHPLVFCVCRASLKCCNTSSPNVTIIFGNLLHQRPHSPFLLLHLLLISLLSPFFFTDSGLEPCSFLRWAYLLHLPIVHGTLASTHFIFLDLSIALFPSFPLPRPPSLSLCTSDASVFFQVPDHVSRRAIISPSSAFTLSTARNSTF